MTTARAIVAGLAAVLVVAALARPAAAASPARLLPGTALRNGAWLSKRSLALAPIGNRAALTARLELAPGTAGGALGLTTMRGDTRLPGWEHLGLELDAAHTYGPSGWAPGTYVGPQLAYGSWSRRVTLGWVFDVEHEANNHPQLGVGFGF